MRTIIREFDGSIHDAEGLLAVERATFDESPYPAEQVARMLSSGPQRAWLAMAGPQVIGFVIAFPTTGLKGQRWEIDLLAVLPEWQGHGLATRLIRAAAASEMATRLTRAAAEARAVVATDNAPSTRAFTRAGFRAQPGTCTLLIYRIAGLTSVPGAGGDVRIREATDVSEVAMWNPDLPSVELGSGVTILRAEREGQPTGYVELIQVETLLYRGLWIESLVVPDGTSRRALVDEAVSQAVTSGLDEIGAMVPEEDWLLRDTLLARGFRSMGNFRWLVARLPLPGLARSPDSGPGRDHGRI
jgi:ribosomal protein S18 acetylase RimI-like enzyme